MANLLIVGTDGTETRVPIFKSLTTIGADVESDVVVAGLSPSAAHIAYDGQSFTIASSDKKDMLVGGKTVRKQILVDDEEIVIGAARFRFLLEDKPQAPKGDAAAVNSQDVDA
jgi:hypothetical protein